MEDTEMSEAGVSAEQAAAGVRRVQSHARLSTGVSRMETSNKPNIVFRVFAGGILRMFAFVPLYIGGGVLWHIIQEPFGTPLNAGGLA